jgi:hypothetical protein
MKNKQLAGKIAFIGFILILVYGLINSIGGDIVLKRYGKCTEAFLYRETYGGHTKPSLGYRFLVDGKTHSGLVVKDGILKIGDSICVIYFPSFPGVNRPINYFDVGDIKCHCNQ